MQALTLLRDAATYHSEPPPAVAKRDGRRTDPNCFIKARFCAPTQPSLVIASDSIEVQTSQTTEKPPALVLVTSSLPGLPLRICIIRRIKWL